MKNMPATLKPWLIKLSTDRLPLLGEKFTQIPTILCPMCHLYKETAKHFLTCTHYPRETEQQTLQTIQVLQKSRIDPYLRFLLRRVLDRQSCSVQDILQANPKFPVNDYKHLLHSQDNIGWLNLLKGYPSIQWDRHQLRYLRENDLAARPGEEYWLTRILVYIHQRTYQRWKKRNTKRHGDESEHKKRSCYSVLKAFTQLSRICPRRTISPLMCLFRTGLIKQCMRCPNGLIFTQSTLKCA